MSKLGLVPVRTILDNRGRCGVDVWCMLGVWFYGKIGVMDVCGIIGSFVDFLKVFFINFCDIFVYEFYL